jgi:hypothetical protein
MPSPHHVPLWLMGLTNLPYGLYGGVVAFAVPQLLGDRNVAAASIASLTAVAVSPGFYAFLFSPILDVRFSRRWYAVTLAMIASLTLVVAFLNLDNLVLLGAALTVGFFAAYLYQSAVGGWLSSITSGEEEKSVSVWVTIGNVGGFSLMAIGCNQLARHFSSIAVAMLLGASILLPNRSSETLPKRRRISALQRIVFGKPKKPLAMKRLEPTTMNVRIALLRSTRPTSQLLDKSANRKSGVGGLIVRYTAKLRL